MDGNVFLCWIWEIFMNTRHRFETINWLWIGKQHESFETKSLLKILFKYWFCIHWLISPFANSEYIKGHGDNRHIRSRDRTKKTKASCVHHATGRSAFLHTQGLRYARLCMVEYIVFLADVCNLFVLKIRYSTVKFHQAVRFRQLIAIHLLWLQWK